jgi:hypothetical protein
MPLNEEGFIDRVSLRHSVSPDAVRTRLRALRSGGGTMAQFSHAQAGLCSRTRKELTTLIGGGTQLQCDYCSYERG